jgi:hypothetical protein
MALFTTARLRLSPPHLAVEQIRGHSIIIHAGGDKLLRYSGAAASARIACGVIKCILTSRLDSCRSAVVRRCRKRRDGTFVPPRPDYR